jgi:hypothetical protein
MRKILPICVWLTGLNIKDHKLRNFDEHTDDSDDERLREGDPEEDEYEEEEDESDAGSGLSSASDSGSAFSEDSD